MTPAGFRLAFLVLPWALLQPGSSFLLRQKKAVRPAPYYWSSGRGSLGSYSKSSYAGVPALSTPPTWQWQSSVDVFAEVPIGTAIDDKSNIYLTNADGIKKLSPDKTILWSYDRQDTNETISKAAALMNGAVFAVTQTGRAFALDMETGKLLWSNQVGVGVSALESGDDEDFGVYWGGYGHVAADEGVVILAVDVSAAINRSVAIPTDIKQTGMDHRLVGLSGTDGRVLWSYTPRIPVFNFGASFAGDGTFIFQDLEGCVHRNRVSDGTLVWKAGGISDSWTLAQANLGPNGLVYGVSNHGLPGSKGRVSAYSFSDGKLVWSHDTPKGANSLPAIGQLAGKSSLSVVVPVGDWNMTGGQSSVLALDAATGEEQWSFAGPVQNKEAAGDGNWYARVKRGFMFLPQVTNSGTWGCATIDGQGKVYLGNHEGSFYSLEDVDGDGVVAGDKEVSSFTSRTSFLASSSPAIAPGMMAITNGNKLMVWKY